jgi:hypothetical protein
MSGGYVGAMGVTYDYLESCGFTPTNAGLLAL